MKRIIFLLLIIPFVGLYAQRIGEIAQEKPTVEFPPNSWGVDVMFGEGGFGLGTFLRKSFSSNLTGFVDFSISESKDEREFEYYDIWGRPIVIGKKNRVFLLPINFGVQQRLFDEVLVENLRPYINIGAGPTLVVTSPYEREFFNSLGYARSKIAIGAYAGFGADFGFSKSNLLGLNIRYYYTHLFDEGVENMYYKFRKNIGSIYITLNIGIMY
ncbi:MAG: hypothetical protein KKD86_14670 [Bacteroidetes bacterium]|nr:hypothetical protein [Bacteroidota bacterium]